MNTIQLAQQVEGIEKMLYFLKSEIAKMGKESIRWHEEDFVQEAKLVEKRRGMPGIYDPAKFHDALVRMIEKHDPEIGITWETIRCYLDDHCLNDA